MELDGEESNVCPLVATTPEEELVCVDGDSEEEADDDLFH